MSWPANVSAPLLHRLVDTQAILSLERAGANFIDAWQARRWAELQGWLTAHVPWWRERLGAHTDWRAPEGWPVLGREAVRALVDAHGAAPVPPHHGALREGQTSGSSGIALRFFATEFSQRIVNHSYAADDERQGRHPYALRAVIDFRKYAGAAPGVDEAPTRTRRINDHTPREDAQWLLDLQPRYLSVYPQWLQWMLEQARADGWPLPRIDQVMTYGAVVDAPVRAIAREMLGASVRDRYSCEECGPLAYQCPASDDFLHVAVENVRLEVVDDAGRARPEGAPGRVLITALHHYATPLVRYDIGDAAALHPHCPGCGLGVPALSQLLGRRRALLRMPDGRLKYVRNSGTQWLACAPGVREHRLVQTTPTDVVAEVVADRPLTETEQAAIVAMLRETLAPELRYRIEQKDRIDRGTSPKRQDFVNLTV